VKKVLSIIFIIIGSVGLYAGGLYTGLFIFAEMKSTTYAQDSIIQLTQAEYALQYLDKGDVLKAHEMLKLNSDVAILLINSLSNHLDEESEVTACKLLSFIAKHRNEFSQQYPEITEMDKEVKGILSNWNTQECLVKT
tara:strand:+ start:469 stop:882 length:414 start_codon:yes stop_codon:yes gene_type:complete